MEAYVSRLGRDMESAAEAAHALGVHFERAMDSVYLGGGTPSILEPRQLEAIFNAIHANFEVSRDAEITVECAPATLPDVMLEALLRCGANRVSLGVQSFVDQEARAVGRLHTREKILADIARLRAAGILQYEISNFSRSGSESRHNLKYWTRRPYLGFGVDAHSMLLSADGNSCALRFATPDSLDAYMASAPATVSSAPVAEQQAWE